VQSWNSCWDIFYRSWSHLHTATMHCTLITDLWISLLSDANSALWIAKMNSKYIMLKCCILWGKYQTRNDELVWPSCTCRAWQKTGVPWRGPHLCPIILSSRRFLPGSIGKYKVLASKYRVAHMSSHRFQSPNAGLSCTVSYAWFQFVQMQPRATVRPWAERKSMHQ
jgi:hypothetical protein